MLATPEEYRSLTVEIENLSKDVFTWLNSLGQNPKAPAHRYLCEFHRHGAEWLRRVCGLQEISSNGGTAGLFKDHCACGGGRVMVHTDRMNEVFKKVTVDGA